LAGRADEAGTSRLLEDNFGKGGTDEAAKTYTGTFYTEAAEKGTHVKRDKPAGHRHHFSVTKHRTGEKQAPEEGNDPGSKTDGKKLAANPHIKAEPIAS